MYVHGQKENRSGEIKIFEYWLCGPIHAEALTYDEHGHGFGLLLRFLDAFSDVMGGLSTKKHLLFYNCHLHYE